jgi:hypothetical protein
VNRPGPAGSAQQAERSRGNTAVLWQEAEGPGPSKREGNQPMLQCSQCEFFQRGPDGKPHLTCDPFSTIKEPECLVKLQLLKLDTMVDAYKSTLQFYERIGPMQEKMFRHMEREIDEAEQADAWKYESEELEDEFDSDLEDDDPDD